MKIVNKIVNNSIKIKTKYVFLYVKLLISLFCIVISLQFYTHLCVTNDFPKIFSLKQT